MPDVFDFDCLKMEYKTFWGATETVIPKINSYVNNNNLYVGLDFLDKEYNTWLPYTDVTVNVGKLPFLESAIDINNNGGAIIEFLIKNGFGELTNKTIQSGFCEFPVFRFNEEKLRKIDSKAFEEYSSAFVPKKSLSNQIKKAEESCSHSSNDKDDAASLNVER